MAYSEDTIHKYRTEQDTFSKVTDLNNTITSVSLSATDRCNRACTICPHGHGFKPVTGDMTLLTALNIAIGLRSIGFKGRIGISGEGEPLLNDKIVSLIRIIKEITHVECDFEIITNGDLLTVSLIHELQRAGISKFLVSMHDGAHQIEHFVNLFAKAKFNGYILRKHWSGGELSFNNRGGYVYKSETVPYNKECYLPFYKLCIGADGQVGMCCQDWNKTVKLGNVNTEKLLDIWLSDALNVYRRKLMNKDRSLFPCNQCDVQGDLHGKASFDIFKEKLNG